MFFVGSRWNRSCFRYARDSGIDWLERSSRFSDRRSKGLDVTLLHPYLCFPSPLELVAGLPELGKALTQFLP
jgi:hypothetical protein